MILIANVLQPLIDVAHAILKFFHDSAGFSWGASIIALTVVVRLGILPLTFKQVKSMQELQTHMPELKKIQDRYKDDSQRKQQETMKYYQEHGVNPLASCLPVVLQIPFFISIFYLLRDPEFKQDIVGEESFLFIKDLAEPATGAVLAVLIVLYVGSQLASSLVTLSTADKMQRRIFLALPFLFVLFIFNFEAGLILYWITTNVWTIGQQLLVRKVLPSAALQAQRAEKLAAAEGEGNGDAPRQGLADRARAMVGSGQENGVANGKGASAKTATAAKAKTVATGGNGGPQKAPPPSPRRKKKRSGRRR